MTVRAAVFTPTPRLTVTVEAGPQGDEVHLHAGGQGVWRLAHGASPLDALRTGAAAGALNVTRRALASGDATTIARLAERVAAVPVDDLSDLDEEHPL